MKTNPRETWLIKILPAWPSGAGKHVKNGICWILGAGIKVGAHIVERERGWMGTTESESASTIHWLAVFKILFPPKPFGVGAKKANAIHLSIIQSASPYEGRGHAGAYAS